MRFSTISVFSSNWVFHWSNASQILITMVNPTCGLYHFKWKALQWMSRIKQNVDLTIYWNYIADLKSVRTDFSTSCFICSEWLHKFDLKLVTSNDNCSNCSSQFHHLWKVIYMDNIRRDGTLVRHPLHMLQTRVWIQAVGCRSCCLPQPLS